MKNTKDYTELETAIKQLRIASPTLSKEQEKAIKELVNVISAQEKKEILEREIIKTKTKVRGKTVKIKLTKLEGYYIAIVAEKYLIISVKYAKLEEFIKGLKIRIHEIYY